MTRAFREDERGVAAVLGGVLIASILVMALVTFRVAYVPALESRHEAEQMHIVEQQLLGLRVGLDRQVENTSRVPLTHPITLGLGTSSIWSAPGGSDLIRFEPGENPIELSSNRLRVIEKNGTSLATLDETWSDTSSASEIEDVTGVQSFRLRVDDLEAGDHGDQILLEVRDKDDVLVGDIRVLVNDEPSPDFNVEVRTRDGDGVVLYDQPYAVFHQTTAVDPYWLDLMDPILRFNTVLAAADAPLTIEFDLKTLVPSDYTMTYLKYDAESGSEVVVGGVGGLVIDDYVSSKTAGHLTYETVNHHLVDQTWVIENGALIIEQGDGKIFKVDPGFAATLVGNQTVLSVTMPNLQGDSGSLMGDGTVTVTTARTGREGYVADASSYVIEVTTDYPSLWKKFWDAELTAAGLLEGPRCLSVPCAAGTGEFNLTTTSDSATLYVYGKTKYYEHTYYDVQVTLRQASIKVEMAS